MTARRAGSKKSGAKRATESAGFPHLSKAPILEGLVDLRVRLPEGFPVERLAEFTPEIANAYPKLETQYLIAGGLHFSPEGGVTPDPGSSSIRGYRRLSSDGRNIVQFRADGFAFSRLAPYETWERMYTEAMRLWDAYVEVAGPLGVTRLATRFVNKFTLPIRDNQDLDLDDYLLTAPRVPKALPQELAAFVVKYISAKAHHEDRTVLFSNVTLSNEQISKQGYYPVILDIDCFIAGQELSADERERIDVLFERLHQMKNLIFFKSLSSRTLELFK